MGSRYSRYVMTEKEFEHYLRYYGSPSQVVVDLKEDAHERTSWMGVHSEYHKVMEEIDLKLFSLTSNPDDVDDLAQLKVRLWALDELITEGELAFAS